MSNSLRLARLVLPQLVVRDYGRPGAPLDASAIAEAPGTYLLFPGGLNPPVFDSGAVRTLVIVDGSWGQARRMVQRVEAIARLPRLSLPPPIIPAARVRHRRESWAMATAEAIAAALRALNHNHAAQALDEAFGLFVKALQRQRGHVGVPRDAR